VMECIHITIRPCFLDDIANVKRETTKCQEIGSTYCARDSPLTKLTDDLRKDFGKLYSLTKGI